MIHYALLRSTTLPAPGEAEGPVHEDVVTGGGGHADQEEQEVGHRQVQDQQVGRVLHLGVPVNLNTCGLMTHVPYVVNSY